MAPDYTTLTESGVSAPSPPGKIDSSLKDARGNGNKQPERLTLPPHSGIFSDDLVSPFDTSKNGPPGITTTADVEVDRGEREHTLQKEILDLKQRRRSDSERIKALQEELFESKARHETAEELSKVYRHDVQVYKNQNRRSEADLLTARIERERDREEWLSESEAYRSENEGLRNRLQESEDESNLRSYFVRRLTLINRKSGNYLQNISRLPRRPAFDVGSPAGVPAWAIGQYLYDSQEDQGRELAIKQWLFCAKLAMKAKDYSKCLNLAFKAARHAFLLNNMPLLAKCSYYRGCAEYADGMYQAALASFEEALRAYGRYSEAALAVKGLARVKRKTTSSSTNWESVWNTEYSNGDEPQVAKVDTVLAAGTYCAQIPLSRWSLDGTVDRPKSMGIKLEPTTEQTAFPDAIECIPTLSRSQPFAPREAQRDLDKEDESVLLRPLDVNDGSPDFYIRPAIPRDALIALTKIGLIKGSLLSEYESDAKTLPERRNSYVRKQKPRKKPPEMPNILEADEISPLTSHPVRRSSTKSSPGYESPSRSSPVFSQHPNRRRPTALQLAERTTVARDSPKRLTTSPTEHYDSSDKDEDLGFDINQHNNMRKPRSLKPRQKENDSPRSQIHIQNSTMTSLDSVLHQTVGHHGPLPAKRNASLQDSQKQILGSTNPSREMFSPTRLEDNGRRRATIQEPSGERELMAKATRKATSPQEETSSSPRHGPRRSSLRSASTQRDTLSKRKVSFSAAHKDAKASPSSGCKSSPNEYLPLASPSLDSPPNPLEGSISPPTPKFKLRRESTGRWSLENSIHGAHIIPRTSIVDLETELTDVGEKLDSPPFTQSIRQKDARSENSPILSDENLGRSLQSTPDRPSSHPQMINHPESPSPTQSPSRLPPPPKGPASPRSPRSAHSRKSSRSRRPSSLNLAGTNDATTAPGILIEHRSTGVSPHIKWASGNASSPQLERRVSNVASISSGASAVHRSPRPPPTPSSSYSTSPDDASPRSVHQRSTSITAPAPYSPVRSSPLNRLSMSSSNESGRAGSPRTPPSPAIERARERRQSSWHPAKVVSLLSPNIGKFFTRRHPSDSGFEGDEEADVGGDEEDGDGEEEVAFTPREQAIFGEGVSDEVVEVRGSIGEEAGGGGVEEDERKIELEESAMH